MRRNKDKFDIFLIILSIAVKPRFKAQVRPQVKQRLSCSCGEVSQGLGCRRQQRLTPLPAGYLLPTQQHSALSFLNIHDNQFFAIAYVNRNLFWSLFLVKKMCEITHTLAKMLLIQVLIC
jgi:hypothetical protein